MLNENIPRKLFKPTAVKHVTQTTFFASNRKRYRRVTSINFNMKHWKSTSGLPQSKSILQSNTRNIDVYA